MYDPPVTRFSVLDILGRFASFWTKAPTVKEPPPKKASELHEAEEARDFVIDWVDLRKEPRTKSRGKAKGSRPWRKVTGITLHQTAVNITQAKRCLNVPVHACVLDGGRDGADATIVLLHDPTRITWHGHGFNSRDIGIEVCARAAGIEGDGRTLWLPKSLRGKGDPLEHASEATDAELEATRRLMRYYAEMVAENGGRLQYVHAHRQSSKSRVSDPGSRIWKACGVWAQETLGLSSGPPGWAHGGLALPDVWTGEANGVRYNHRVDGRLTDVQNN